MLITTQTTLALRCPNCGKLEFYSLSRFSVKKGAAHRIICECGALLISVNKKEKNSYKLQIECIMCDSKHIMSMRSRDLWNNKGIPLKCDHIGLEIGYLGCREFVTASVNKMERSIREMAEDLGYDKYFLNPEVMFKALELLRSMADHGKMSCSCGSAQLEVEVFPDRIELRCPNCEAVGVVFAETVKDLQRIADLKEISLEAYTSHYLDRKKLKKQSPQKK